MAESLAGLETQIWDLIFLLYRIIKIICNHDVFNRPFQQLVEAPLMGGCEMGDVRPVRQPLSGFEDSIEC